MSTNAKLRFGLWYDFRNPPAWKRPYDQLYGEIFDQIVWGEQHGFADIWLSEHHFIEDGYSPALLPIAAAIAARPGTPMGTSAPASPKRSMNSMWHSCRKSASRPRISGSPAASSG